MSDLPPLPDTTPDTAAPPPADRPSDGPPPPPPPAAPADLPALPETVAGLSCPGCGGPLEVVAGSRVVSCPYCETPLLALGELGMQRFAVEPEVDQQAARARVERWWRSGWHLEPKLKRQAETAEAFLCFLPFFRLQADAVGYALGTEKRRRTVGSGKNRRTETYEVDVERRTERHYDRTLAAVNVAEWGVYKVDLTGDRLIPFDDDRLTERGMVFPATGSEPELRAAARHEIEQQADPGKGLHRVRFRFLTTVRERFTVVYYPLWVVRYRFRERAYQAVVDAESGDLAYGKAPGNDLYRALMLVGTQAAACFVFTTALQWIDDPIPALAFGGGAALALISWGWTRFRYGGVVEEGTGHVKKRPSFKKLLKEKFK